MSIFNIFSKNKEKKELEIIVDKLDKIGRSVSNDPHSLMRISIDECKELINHKRTILKSHYNFFRYPTKSVEDHFKTMSEHYDAIMEAISYPQSFSAATVRHPQLFIDFFTKEEGAELIANWEKPFRISTDERGNWVIKSIKRKENYHSNE